MNIFEYKMKIAELLREKPELRELQDKIDRALENAGSQHNRCVVIQQMMIDSMTKLADKLKELT